MKKWFCVLLASLLCLAGIALAEEAPAEPFEHLWVSEADEEDTVEIWFDGGKWDLLAMRFTGEEVYSILFDRVFYDEAQKALICEGGTLYLDSLTKEEEAKETEEEPDLGEVMASGFGAALTVNENGLLHWTGSGDAWADRAYANGDFINDGLYTGEWQCGGFRIIIRLRRGVYEASVLVDVNDNELVYWEYTCALDASGALTGFGSKYAEAYSEETESYIQTQVCPDGETAFVLDGGALLWEDKLEDAGNGLRFERVAEQEEDYDEDGEEI